MSSQVRNSLESTTCAHDHLPVCVPFHSSMIEAVHMSLTSSTISSKTNTTNSGTHVCVVVVIVVVLAVLAFIDAITIYIYIYISV